MATKINYDNASSQNKYTHGPFFARLCDDMSCQIVSLSHEDAIIAFKWHKKKPGRRHPNPENPENTSIKVDSVGLVSDRNHFDIHTSPDEHDRTPRSSAVVHPTWIRLGNQVYAKKVRKAHTNTSLPHVKNQSIANCAGVPSVPGSRTWFGPVGGSLSCTNLIFSIGPKQKVQDGGVALLKHGAPRDMQNGRPPRSD